MIKYVWGGTSQMKFICFKIEKQSFEGTPELNVKTFPPNVKDFIYIYF